MGRPLGRCPPGPLGSGIVFCFLILIIPASLLGKAPPPFVERVSVLPHSNNILAQDDALWNRLTLLLFDRLMMHDPNSFEIVPRLAKSVQHFPKARKIRVKIRPGVKFHDGQALTAEDLVYTFNSRFETDFLRAKWKEALKAFDRATRVDKYTVDFHLKTNDPLALSVVRMLKVFPRHIYAKYNTHKKAKKIDTFLGSGPYMFDRFIKNNRIVFKRNPDWWGWQDSYFKGLFNFETLSFKYVPEIAVALQMIAKGSLHYTALSPEEYYAHREDKGLKGKVKFVRVKNNSTKVSNHIVLNLQAPLFADVRVRKALNLLVPRRLMNDKLNRGDYSLATGPWHQKARFASPKVEALEFNPTAALQLLRTAGWEDRNRDGLLEKEGRKFSFTIQFHQRSWEKYLTLYKEALRKQGITLHLRLTEVTGLVKAIEERNFDALLIGVATLFSDRSPSQRWHTRNIGKKGSLNYSAYSNPEVDRLLDQTRFEWDQKQKFAGLRKIYEKLSRDYPYIFLFDPVYTFYAVSPKVHRPQDSLQYYIGKNTWSWNP